MWVGLAPVTQCGVLYRTTQEGGAEHLGKLRKNEVLYCDTVGPLHQAESGDTYMFTTLDGFTRYATATPVPNKKATTMAACL